MVTYYAINAGGNWNVAGTWSTIATKDVTRVGGAVVPGAGDDCILDDYSGSVTVNHATQCLCKTLVCTGHTGTLTFTAACVLFCSGNVTFASTMALSGTGTLNINAAATALTSAGLTFPGALTFSVSSTKVLADNWTVTGLFTSATTTQTVNGNNLYCNGGIFVSGSINGSTNLVLGGGVWWGTGTVGGTGSLAFAGNSTVSGGVTISAKSLIYTSGAVTTTGSTLNPQLSMTLNTNGVTFNNITLGTSNQTYTISSPLTCTGLFNVDNTAFTTATSAALNLSYFRNSPSVSAISWTFASGSVITINKSLQLNGYSNNFATFKSSTASSPIYLNYTGTAASCAIYGYNFTDVNAAGSAIGLDNWYGGTLTRCTNITNRTSADIGGGGTPSVFVNVGDVWRQVSSINVNTM